MDFLDEDDLFIWQDSCPLAWDELPSSAWMVVFGSLPIDDILACRQACSVWKTICDVLISGVQPRTTANLDQLIKFPNLQTLSLHNCCDATNSFSQAHASVLHLLPYIKSLKELQFTKLGPAHREQAAGPPAGPAHHALNRGVLLAAGLSQMLRQLQEISIPAGWISDLAASLSYQQLAVTKLQCVGNNADRPAEPQAAGLTTLPLCPTFNTLQILYLTSIPYLSGGDISHIVQLTSLTMLHLSTVRRADAEALTTLTQLQHLRSITVLNSFPDSSQQLFASLSSLTKLDHVDFCDTLPATPASTSLAPLSSLTSMTHLDLSWCAFSSVSTRGQLEALLPTLANLVSLHLMGCDHLQAHTLAPAMPHLTSLQVLSLAQCDSLDVTLLPPLPPSLTFLNLSWSLTATDDFLHSHVAPLPALRSLLLGRCSRITHRGVHQLAPLTALLHLDLHKCPRLLPHLSPPTASTPSPPHSHRNPCPLPTNQTDPSPPIAPPLLAPHPPTASGGGFNGLSPLQQWSAAQVSAWQDAQEVLCHMLGGRWRLLRSLNVWGCVLNLGELWPLLCEHLTDLQDLTLRHCPHFPDPPALAPTSRLTALTSLDISYTSAGPPHLPPLTQAPSLRTLRLAGCAAISDAHLPPLARHPRLATLDLRDCPAVTAEGLRTLLQVGRRGYLSRVILSEGPHLPPEAVEAAAAEHPLVRLHVCSRPTAFAAPPF